MVGRHDCRGMTRLVAPQSGSRKMDAGAQLDDLLFIQGRASSCGMAPLTVKVVVLST